MGEISGMKKKADFEFSLKIFLICCLVKNNHIHLLKSSNSIIHISALTFSPVATLCFPNLYQFIANRTTGISFIVYEKVIICLVY